jgi:hypothetical protein
VRVDTELWQKYDGKDPDPDRPGAVRVIVRMVVGKATGYAALADRAGAAVTGAGDPPRWLRWR